MNRDVVPLSLDNVSRPRYPLKRSSPAHSSGKFKDRHVGETQAGSVTTSI